MFVHRFIPEIIGYMGDFTTQLCMDYDKLAGESCFIFIPIWGNDLKFDKYVSSGLKTPTSKPL